MHATWQRSGNFPYDNALARSTARPSTSAKQCSGIDSANFTSGVLSAMKLVIGVVVYAIVSLCLATAAMGIVLLVLPWLLVVPAALTGLLVIASGFVFMFLGLLS